MSFTPLEIVFFFFYKAAFTNWRKMQFQLKMMVLLCKCFFVMHCSKLIWEKGQKNISLLASKIFFFLSFFCACSHQLALNISIQLQRGKLNLLFVLVFPSGQTIRWRCTSSTEMERRSQWRARLEIRCLMSSSMRTSTLMALVCKHTHLLTHTHTHTEIYRSGVIGTLFPFLPCFSISILFTFLIICDIRVKMETFHYLTWLKLILQTITKSLCAFLFCFFSRSMWGNPGVFHLPRDLWWGRLQEPGTDHRRGDGHARLGLRLDGHVGGHASRTHTHTHTPLN